MDARTNIKGRLPIRHVTEAIVAACGPTNAALHLPAIDLFDVGEIFKKTPCVAGLKPGGRYVAKDMYEVGGIPLLMKSLLDNGPLHGDCTTVTGQTIAETLKSAMRNPHQDVVRSANRPITVTSGAVGLKGILAPKGAIVKAAGMLQDGDIIEIDAEVGTANVKLSDAELAEYKTKGRPRATNQTSGARWKDAQQVGPAVDGAVAHPGGAHEKQCYADI